MKNLIITDIETTGLNVKKCSILSIGAVHYATQSTFYGECQRRCGSLVEKAALAINGFTTKDINDPAKKSEDELYLGFESWCSQYASPDIILGGHNIGRFDMIFLEKVASYLNRPAFFSYRSLDLHSLYYAKYGMSLSHKEICLALELEPEAVPHNALNGAFSEYRAIRKILEG